MPNTIRHKRNATAAAVPTAASLVPGELAVNTADGRVYTERDNGTVVDVAAAILATGQRFVCALGDKDNCGLAPVGDLHTGLFFGADIVNVSTGGVQRMQIDANGNVGINNNAVTNTRLIAAQTLTNATGFGAQFNTNAVASANGAYATFGLQVNVNHNIPTGVANSNVSRAMLVTCARNNGFPTDAGSLGFVRGMEFQYGHGNGNAAITPTTTQVIGLQMVPLVGPGTITDLYDIFIGSTAHNTGTLGNHFSIYQAQATAKNYFAGTVGIGRTAPSSALDVNGTAITALGTKDICAYGFTGDAGTGIFSPGTDQVAISTGSVEAMRITATGQVGIGTNNPAGQIHVLSSTAGETAAWLTGVTTAQVVVDYLGGGSNFYDGASHNFRIQTGSRSVFTIGTSRCTAIADSERYALGAKFSPSGGTVYFGAASASATPDVQISNAAGGALLYMQNGGNVGIGRTDPSYKLDVMAGALGATAGDSVLISRLVSTSANSLFLQTTLRRISNGSDWTTTALRVQAQVDATPFGYIDYLNGSSASMAFGRGTTEFVRIGDTGNVGIGTIAPTFKLHVVGSAYLNGDLTTLHYTETVRAIGNSGTAQTIALTNGTVHTVTLTGNCTFTMPTATAGKSFTVLLKTGAGSFTATFTGVKWPGNVAPTITATASRLDLISFIADGTNWYGNIAQNYTP